MKLISFSTGKLNRWQYRRPDRVIKIKNTKVFLAKYNPPKAFCQNFEEKEAPRQRVAYRFR